MARCDACGLCDVGMSNNIPGRGRELTGGFLLVGQNPGAKEDLEEKPFVGPTGRILGELLDQAGYILDDVRFTNAVRCRTPLRNRQPFDEEINACRPHLKEEILKYRPSAIIALGDTALQALTKKGGIKNQRGQELQLHGEFGYKCPVWPTYHPAVVFKPALAKLRDTIIKDLGRARTGVGDPDPIAWEWWTGDRKMLDLRGVLAYDIETDFLHGGKGDIVQVAVSDGDITFVARGFDMVYDLIETLTGAQEMGGHFAWKFDGHRIAEQLGIKLKYGFDTAALAYLDDETQPLSLEALCIRYLGVLGWKEGLHAPLDSDAFAAYNARDAFYTWGLRKALVDILGERKNIHDIIMRPMRRTLDDMSRRGLKIDKPVVTERRIKNESKLTELREFINYTARDLGIEKPVNPNAPAQIAELLMVEGHVELPLSKKTGKPGAPIGVLNELQQTPLVVAIKEHREIAKENSGFCIPYERQADIDDGRTHSDFDIWRTLSGRSNSKALNIQQLDRDLRDFYRSEDGFDLVSVDYEQVEFWMGAWASDAHSIIQRKMDNPKWDPHTYFATLLYPGSTEEEVDADRKNPNGKRQVAKSGNFSQEYMGGGPTLFDYAKKMGITTLSMGECFRIHHKWHEVFPEYNGGETPYKKRNALSLDGWYLRVYRELESTSQSRTATGFIRHFGNFHDLPWAERLEALRQAVNVKVQGLSAHIAFLGASALRRRGYPLNGFFHDSVTMELREGLLSQKREEIVYCLCDEPLRILKKHFGVDIPRELLNVEIKVQKRKETAA